MHGFVENPLLRFHVCQPSLTAGPANSCLASPQIECINKHKELKECGLWERVVFAEPQQMFDDIGEYFKSLYLKLNKWTDYQNAQWLDCKFVHLLYAVKTLNQQISDPGFPCSFSFLPASSCSVKPPCLCYSPHILYLLIGWVSKTTI